MQRKIVLGTICIMIISFLGLLLLLIPSAHANTVTLDDLQLTSCQVVVYEINSTGNSYVGTINSTDSINLEPTSNYIFVFKPSVTDYAFTNPNGVFAYIQENIGTAFQVGIVLAVLFAFVVVMTWGRR